MPSEQNQKDRLNQLRDIYEQMQHESSCFENTIKLMQTAKKVYAEFMQGQTKSYFSVHQVHKNNKGVDSQTHQILAFDWEKFYQES